jgi:hypothetical protein
MSGRDNLGAESPARESVWADTGGSAGKPAPYPLFCGPVLLCGVTLLLCLIAALAFGRQEAATHAGVHGPKAAQVAQGGALVEDGGLSSRAPVPLAGKTRHDARRGRR